jgi:hypothetical protein
MSSELLLKELEDLIERRAQSAMHSAEVFTPEGLEWARKREVKKLITTLDTLMGRPESVE